MKGFLKKCIQPTVFTALGSAMGLAYYQFIGCPTGTCPITSSVWSTMVYTGLIGLLVSRVVSESRKA